MVNVVAQPTIDSFTSTETDVAIGQGFTLEWMTTGASAVTASGDWLGGKAFDGSELISEATSGTKTYTLTAFSIGGTDVQSVLVTVHPPPQIVSFTSTQSQVLVGSSVTLSWTTAGGTTVTASDDWSGTKALNGSEIVTPTLGVNSYTLTVDGIGGTVQQTVQVEAQSQGAFANS
jgi:plastocyanin